MHFELRHLEIDSQERLEDVSDRRHLIPWLKCLVWLIRLTPYDLYYFKNEHLLTLIQMVGNEFVRGLSGGERKRTTITEAMVSRYILMINHWGHA